MGCVFSPIVELPTAISAVWRRMGVHLFEGKLTVADMDRLEEAGAAWHRIAPGKTVELVVIFPSDAQMTTPERERMAKIIKRWENERLASSTVILAEGLIGSLHRSVLTGLQMLAPAPHPVKIYGKIPPALGWLTRYVREVCGPDVTTEQLVAGVDALCARFHAR